MFSIALVFWQDYTERQLRYCCHGRPQTWATEGGFCFLMENVKGEIRFSYNISACTKRTEIVVIRQTRFTGSKYI